VTAPPRDSSSAARRAGAWYEQDWLFALVVTLLGLALRVAVVLLFAERPMWDGEFYHRGASRIAQGFGYSEDVIIDGRPKTMPWSHYPVGYSALLGAAYRVFGESHAVATLSNAAIGALMVPFAFAFARRLLGPRRARTAALLVALHPGLILYCTLLMTEPAAALLSLVSAYFAYLWGERRWAPLAAGVAIALSAFVRPQALFIAPLLVLLFSGNVLARLAKTGAAVLVAVVLILPWTYRNCRVLDGCALISTNGGWNLAISALSETGRFRPLTPADGCADAVTPVVQDRCWAKVGWERIKRDPHAWLAHIPDKLRHTYNHESFAVAYLAEANPTFWFTERKHLTMQVMTALHHALTFAAALAAVGRFRWRFWRERRAWPQAAIVFSLLGFVAYALAQPERPLFWIAALLPLLGLIRLPGSPPLSAALTYLYALVAVTSLTHMVFFGDDRYHLAISPVLCLLAAAALRRPAHEATAEERTRVPEGLAAT
jgi:4-amino-4-deoxy-L-arabinose transferase-like glycosyltransferase